MRIVIFKFCYNIKWKGKETGVILYEITEPIKELLSQGHEVSVVTIDRYHKDAPSGVKCRLWSELIDPAHQKDWDAAIIFNGPTNMYGGKLAEPTMASYRFLNMFNKPILFCVTDTAIPLSSLSDWIKNAQSKGEYKELAPSDYEFNPKKIFCLTQCHDVEKFSKHWKQETNGFGMYRSFPFHMYAMKKENLHLLINPVPSRDLIYFGNMRSGRRNEKFVQYFCSHPESIKVDVYGNWEQDKIAKFMKGRLPNCLGAIDTKELNREINASLATVYISDEFNEGTIWTTRFYEAVINRTIMFVDRDNDPHRTIFPEFFYVNSRIELQNKLMILKSDDVIRRKLLDIQFKCLYNDFKTMKNLPNRWTEAINEAISNPLP